jgi:hypothetical protein
MDCKDLMELEVNLLIRIYSEDANKNGHMLKLILVFIPLRNQIMKKLPKKRLKLKELPRNLNGIKITGTWAETNMMTRLKQLLHQRKKVKLQLNKKLNHSSSSQLILQQKWKSRKQILKRETLNNLHKLKLNSTLNSLKLLNSKPKLKQTRKSLMRSKLKP